MNVRHLIVVVTAAFLPLCAMAEETPNVFDCVYEIAGGCEYEEWGVRSGSFAFDNSFGPFTNGVFYSRNDGGSHVLTGLCMKVLHKGTMESARSQIRGMQGELTKELSSSHGGIEFSVESDVENLFILRCPDIDGYENSCTFVARRSADGYPVDLSCDIIYVGPSPEEIERRRHYLCDHQGEIESYIRQAVIGPFDFVDATGSEIIARLSKAADAKIKERLGVVLECSASFNNKTRYSFCICVTNIFAAFQMAAQELGLDVSLSGNELSISPRQRTPESSKKNDDSPIGQCGETLGAEWPYRCVLRAPKGVDRLGFGYFNGISFGEGYIKQDGDFIKTNEEGSGFVVDRLLQEKYLRFRRIKLFYSKARQRLYKLVLERDINGEETARETNGDVERMVKEFSWNYATAFTKITSDGKDLTGEDQLKRVYSYQNSDVDYPIEISVLKRNDSKALKVSIQSNAVLRKLEGAERKKKTATEPMPFEPVQVEVDI